MFITLTTSASSVYVSNSQDWSDVLMTMQLAEDRDQSPHFTRSRDGGAVLDDLPLNSQINLIQSSDNSYLPNLDTQIETQDSLNLNQTTLIEDSTEIVPDDLGTVVVVSKDQPTSALVGAPLAQALNGWVVVIGDDNLQQVEDILDQTPEVVAVGSFTNAQGDIVDQYSTETIDEDNRFELSVTVAERIDQVQDFNTVLISDGNYLERDIVQNDQPVILSGTNFMPETSMSYIVENFNLGSAIVIGPELANVGQEIGQEMDSQGRDQFSVFAKFGHARGGDGGGQVDAVPLFSLPTPEMDLRIDSAQISPDENKFLATFRNPSDVDGYLLSSITIVDAEGNAVDTFGDDEPRFIGSESSAVFSYDTDVDEATALSGAAEFTTSYGTSRGNLDTYVQSIEDGVYDPPRVLQISTIDLVDRSDVEVQDAAYDVDQRGFNVTVSNTGSVPAYSRTDIDQLEVDGFNTAVSSEVFQLDVNETETVFVPADLEEEDIEQNQEVEVRLRYGEARNYLINERSRLIPIELPEEVESFVDSNYFLWLLILLILVIAYLVYRYL